jgi:hypothetical protein
VIKIKTLHVAMFSGGLSSAFVLDHIIKEYGRENTVAFHTDTKWEDEDNYRFMRQVIGHLEARYIYKADGRTPPQVWIDKRFLVGRQWAWCSMLLKTEQTKQYIAELREQGIEPILYFGIGQAEKHRAVNIAYRYDVECQFPLVDNPLSNEYMTAACEAKWKIRIPRMYRMGFSHANCGGRCIKGGHKHFRLLLSTWPERYAEVEMHEKEFRRQVNSRITILKDRRGGQTKYMTLESFRKRIQAGTIFDYPEADTVPCECVC